MDGCFNNRLDCRRACDGSLCHDQPQPTDETITAYIVSRLSFPGEAALCCHALVAVYIFYSSLTITIVKPATIILLRKNIWSTTRSPGPVMMDRSLLLLQTRSTVKDVIKILAMRMLLPSRIILGRRTLRKQVRARFPNRALSRETNLRGGFQ